MVHTTYAILNFPEATLKTGKEKPVKLILIKLFNSIRVYLKYYHFQHVIGIKMIIDTFCILFVVVLSLLNTVTDFQFAAPLNPDQPNFQCSKAACD